MNKRLQAIQTLIPPGRGVIDVGTDHGFLPIQLAKTGYPGRLFASDIRPGPLGAARWNAVEAGVADRIGFLLCDGLDLCDPRQVDTVVVAGMGGDTICGILDRAEWTMDPGCMLVLQPMTRAEVLRYWLSNNDYEIIREELVLDAGRLYQILVVRFGRGRKLRDAELFTGEFALVRDHALFPDLLRGCRERLARQLNGLEKGSRDPGEGRCRLLRNILKEMEEMREYADSK